MAIKPKISYDRHFGRKIDESRVIKLYNELDILKNPIVTQTVLDRGIKEIMLEVLDSDFNQFAKVDAIDYKVTVYGLRQDGGAVYLDEFPVPFKSLSEEQRKDPYTNAAFKLWFELKEHAEPFLYLTEEKMEQMIQGHDVPINRFTSPMTRSTLIAVIKGSLFPTIKESQEVLNHITGYLSEGYLNMEKKGAMLRMMKSFLVEYEAATMQTAKTLEEMSFQASLSEGAESLTKELDTQVLRLHVMIKGSNNLSNQVKELIGEYNKEVDVYNTTGLDNDGKNPFMFN